MKVFLKILVLLTVLFYPFAIYFGLAHFSTRYLLLAIACVFLLRFFISKKQASVVSQSTSISIVMMGLVVCVLGIIFNSIMMVKLYPVFVNAILFVFFFHSLFNPPSVIEKIARMTNPLLPVKAIAYTRKVTMVWCTFFLINGAISLWTVFFESTKIWTLYNGLISYFLMGLLFIIEYAVRVCVRKKHEQ